MIHHDGKPKLRRFYFTLSLDRTMAWLKVQELVSRINNIVDDLSFLYSIAVQASAANLSLAVYFMWLCVSFDVSCPATSQP